MTTKTQPIGAQSDLRNSSPAPGSKSSAGADNGDIAEITKLQDRVKKLESQLAHHLTASNREKQSLLKLVIGMAQGGYRFDPKPARSRTTKEITDDLKNAGVPLDEDTIRKFLRQASELLPADD